jgi:hypothetical protein
VGLSNEAKGLLKGILIFSIPAAIIGFFLVPINPVNVASIFGSPFTPPAPRISFLLGMGIGVLMSMLKVILTELSLKKALSQDVKHAALGIGIGILPRLLLTVAALFASAYFLSLFGIIGAVIAGTSLTVSAYLIKYLQRKKAKSKGKE